MARRTLAYLLGTLGGTFVLTLAAGFGLGGLFVRWPSGIAGMLKRIIKFHVGLLCGFTTPLAAVSPAPMVHLPAGQR